MNTLTEDNLATSTDIVNIDKEIERIRSLLEKETD